MGRVVCPAHICLVLWTSYESNLNQEPLLYCQQFLAEWPKVGLRLCPPLLPINFSFVILVFCISFDQSEIGELRRKGLPTFIQSVILNFGLFVPPFEGEGQTFVFSPRFFVAIMNASFRFDHISADGPPPQRLQSVRLDIHLSTCFYFLFLTKHIFNCPASKELRKHFSFLELETL